MLIDWHNCQRCDLHKSRKGSVKMCTNSNGKIMLILSESIPEDDRRKVFLEKVLENASESSVDSYDLAIVEVVGCDTDRSVSSLNNPFKDTTGLKPKEIGVCKARIHHLIDQVDPHLIIVSGAAAARSVGLISGLTKMFNTQEIREVEIPGHLMKVPRMVAAIPTLNWLANNFSRDPEGSTATVVRLFRKAIDYSKLRDQVIGDKNV